MNLSGKLLRNWRVLLAATMGAALTVLAYDWVLEVERRARTERFDVIAEEVLNRFRDSADSSLEHLETLHRFLEISGSVNRRDFGRFAGALLKSDPAVQALEWVPRVPEANRAAFEATARAEGFTGFRITQRSADGTLVPAGARREYFPVTFLAPFEGNQKAFGFDLGSGPSRLQTLEAARDSGTMAATARIALVQESAASNGFLAVLPVYAQSKLPITAPITVQSRREHLTGFVLAVFRVSDIAASAISQSAAGREEVDILVVDRQASEAEQLLFVTSGGETTQQGFLDARLLHVALLPIADRQWQVFVKPKGDALAPALARQSTFVVLLGMLLTLSMCVFIHLSRKRRLYAEELATARTQELSRAMTVLEDRERRIRSVHETMLDGLVTIDDRGVIENINPAAERIFGYVQGELIGRNVSALMPEPDHSRHDGYLRHHLDTGERKIIGIGREVIGLRKDGTRFPLDLRISEMRLGDALRFTGIVRDITEQKRAEEGLRASQQLLQTVVDTLPLSVFVMDRQSNCLLVNRSMCEFYGIDRKHFLAMRLHDLPVDPDFLMRAREADERVFETGEPHIEPEAIMRNEAGEETIWSIHRLPLSDESGRVARLIGVAQDVTEARIAERVLRESAQVLDQISDAVIVTDLNARVTRWSKAAERMYGFSVDEMLGGTLERLWPAGVDRGTSQRTLLQGVLQGTSRTQIVERQHKSGEPLFVSISLTPLRGQDGEPYGVIGTSHDVTEMVRIERALRESEERLRAVVTNAPIVLYGFDRSGVFTLSEGKGLELLGRRAGEAVGQSIAEIYEAQPEIQEYVWRALAGESFTVDVEVSGHFFEAYYAPRNDAQGNVDGAIGMAFDITERKKAEAAKSEFVSNVSHELRTPLASIVGYVDLILEGDVGETTPEQTEFLQIVSQNAVRLTHLINDILDVEKLEAGRIAMAGEFLDLSPVLVFAQHTFQVLADEKGIELIVDVPEHLPVRGDKHRLTQVVSNLVSNAVKYTRTGWVRVSAKKADDSIVVAIADSGIGMDQDALGQLFSRFFRADDAYARAAGGTGLGLAITKAIVIQHGGTIEVASQPGAGSEFTVRLPAAEPEPVAAVDGPQPRVRTGESARVLILDDNPDFARLLQHALDRMGISADVVLDGGAAIDSCKSRDYSIAVLDYHLPDINGLEVYRSLKSTPNPAMAAILISGETLDPSVEQEAEDLGFLQFLNKRVGTSEIAHAIETHLSLPRSHVDE